MACIRDEQAGLVSIDDESLQEIARKLPEGDALPDGFSECPTELGSQTKSQEGEVPLEVNAVQCEGSLQGDCADPYGILISCERSSVSSGSSNASIDLNDGSPSATSISPRKKRERLRSFPVQLSSAENLEDDFANGIHVEVEEHVPQKGNLSMAGDGNQCAKSVVDATSVEETRDAPTLEIQIQKDIRDAEQDASPEIDQLIHGTALSDNGIQTVEGLHSSLLQDEIADLRKQNEQLTNEKLLINAQLAKSSLVREKLESLCRELQRHNKQLTDECKRIASEEQQKRLDLSSRFHDAIKDVTAKLEEQGDERLRQIKQNELLQEKLRQLTRQFEFQEQQYSQQLKTKALEYQILEVKLKQQEEINRQGEAKLSSLTEHISQLLQTEEVQKGRLAMYGEKFEQFQDMLTKSNEVFASFKSQMEKMSKTIKVLEKENLAYQKKCEKTDVSLIELIDEGLMRGSTSSSTASSNL
ncbi:hypothetical protein GOP47_0008073 [Adiantum capillus-veneris]|uniref:Uncharacterized protein n=1 Tax=Adiantum capillus-veneris TaxID=13818 RepID=A0A9D4UYM8_ADICA|nr:hypothetical protein GOP47_0008073 [Adiantum capillus-veneris]